MHTATFTAPEARILAVDDNRPNLSIVNALLKETRMKIDLCTDGRQALTQCRKNQYDLILLDHMMPEPDGIQTLDMIRTDSHSKNRSTPAAVLTANAVAGSREMYMKAGFADYLAKPLDSRLLEETVRRYIPQDKVHDGPPPKEPEPGAMESEILEFEPEGETETNDTPVIRTEQPEQPRPAPAPIPEIEGIDRQTGLIHTGGSEDLLRQIMLDIAMETPDKVAALRRTARDGDLKGYRITAHSIKGLMATIGAGQLSERARMHEYAAANGQKNYITAHVEELIQEYEQITGRITEALK